MDVLTYLAFFVGLYIGYILIARRRTWLGWFKDRFGRSEIPSELDRWDRELAKRRETLKREEATREHNAATRAASVAKRQRILNSKPGLSERQRNALAALDSTPGGYEAIPGVPNQILAAVVIAHAQSESTERCDDSPSTSYSSSSDSPSSSCESSSSSSSSSSSDSSGW